jgi:thiol:disulfide interchange protein
MKIGKIDKVELSGLIVLFIGVILLAFTFFSAYAFLSGELSILATGDILQVFGESLAPLIEAIIRILYLGIMGWIGSLITIRAVQLLKKEKTEAAQTQQQPVKTESTQETKQESKPEAKEAKTEAEKPTKIKETEKTETPENPKQVEKPEEAATLSSPTSTPAPQ